MQSIVLHSPCRGDMARPTPAQTNRQAMNRPGRDRYWRIRLAFVLACAGPAWGAGIVVPAGSHIDFGTGSARLNCADLSIAGTVNGGAASLDGIRDVGIATGGTLVGGSAQYLVSGNWDNAGNFQPDASTVEFTDGCRPASTLAGDSSFFNLTFSSSQGKQFKLHAGNSQTVNNLLTLQGTPQSPLSLVSSDPVQAAYIPLAPTASVNRANSSVLPNVIIGAQAVGTTQDIPTLSTLALALLSALIAWSIRPLANARRRH